MDSKNYKEVEVVLIEEAFKKVFSKYVSVDLVDELFRDVYEKYTHSSRHYHNMHHICYMVGLWETDTSRFKNADAIFMAIIYHDIIYKSRRSDNEEKSAEYFEKIAETHLKSSLNAGTYFQLLDDVKCAILATKHNDTSIAYWKDNLDIQYLLDFDLAILGTKHKDTYEWYRKGVRKEYKIYPNILYKPGRKKVLESFLSRKKIYLTKDFEDMEKIARKNLQEEINSYLC
jgi:predicted metal-dependent HD superfamily phosphohydrolase